MLVLVDDAGFSDYTATIKATTPHFQYKQLKDWCKQ